MWRHWPITILYTFLFLNPVFAGDINLTLHQKSINDLVTITITNHSLQSVVVKSLYIELDNKEYNHPAQAVIPSNQNKSFLFNVKFPLLPGSYPLIVTARYFNDDRILSLRHVGIFYFKEPAITDASCSAENTSITGEGDIRITASAPEQWRLVLPEEIEIVSDSIFMDHRIFHVKSKIIGFNNNYPFFAVKEEVTEGKHRMGICGGNISVTAAPSKLYDRGSLSPGILITLALVFLFAAYFILHSNRQETRFFSTLGKYTSRMFFLTFSYYCLKNADYWLTDTLKFIDWPPLRYFISTAVTNFQGGNYQNFFQYFIDAYLAACFFLNFPCLYWFAAGTSMKDDKYVSFIKTLFSFFTWREKIHWNKQSKLGMLTILVKIFFIPILVSWSINNIIHITKITPSIQWNIYAVNAYLVDLFILIDTAIFAFGYLVESRYLKSEIKTVEPTFLGWLVCLWCYPPFNVFSFKPFDYEIINIAYSSPEWVHLVMTCIITLMWGIFAWASIALGFKASNLTNRGIIKSGPYRFVRHPAYFAKLIIWLIQAIFFARFGIGIIAGFILIYVLRAWTEERHLSMDPDYLEYKKIVRWKFIPGVI